MRTPHDFLVREVAHHRSLLRHLLTASATCQLVSALRVRQQANRWQSKFRAARDLAAVAMALEG